MYNQKIQYARVMSSTASRDRMPGPGVWQGMVNPVSHPVHNIKQACQCMAQSRPVCRSRIPARQSWPPFPALNRGKENLAQRRDKCAFCPEYIARAHQGIILRDTVFSYYKTLVPGVERCTFESALIRTEV
jgi:hypothetical protein